MEDNERVHMYWDEARVMGYRCPFDIVQSRVAFLTLEVAATTV